MADDLNDKLDQVKNLLENEDMVNNLKNILNMLSNSIQEDSKQISSQTNPENTSVEKSLNKMSQLNTSSQQPSMDATMDTIIRIKNVYDKISKVDDPRINLLTALKPYLSPRRKAKVDTAIKVANLTKLSSVISKEFDRL